MLRVGAPAPTGLYGWIRSNDARSSALFGMFLIAVQLIAAVVLFIPLILLDPAHAPLLGNFGYTMRYVPVVLVASVLWFGWEMFWHVERVKRAVGFRFVDAGDEPRLCHIFEPLIIATGLPVPFVGVVESSARNAFACGIARKKAVIVVTRGLLDHLTDNELAAVLAHEIGHIKHGDIRLMAATNIFMTGLGKLHSNHPLRFTPIHAVMAIAIPAILIVTIIGSFVAHIALRVGQATRLMLASSREFIADAEAAQLTKNPAALASALIKVGHDYRLDSARHEDDAMMIAGDTTGPDATHPTVAQRIAALARTTGSMVFNAPGAPSADVSASFTEARAAALLRDLPPSQILPRLRMRARENWLGMTRFHSVTAVLTVAALVGIHWSEIGNARTIAAKFDPRPISIIFGGTLACYRPNAERCGIAIGESVYRDFEGQRNTLAGWLADLSKQRRAKGFLVSDVGLLTDPDAAAVRAMPYTGESGRVTGLTVMKHPNGTVFVNGQSITGYPPGFEAAEIRQVGCFTNWIEGGDILPVDQPRKIGEHADQDMYLSTLSREADDSLDHFDATAANASAQDAKLYAYVDTREQHLNWAYGFWGRPGLEIMQATYRDPRHAAILARIAVRLKDPAFLRPLDERAQARIERIARTPDAFVPCVMLAERNDG